MLNFSKSFKQSLILLTGVVLAISACSEKKVDSQAELTGTCFQAIFQRDTAWLNIDTTKQAITGDFRIHYWAKNQKYIGNFRGQMHGDTLRGNFNFKINDMATIYSNPVAFLKKDGKFIMGAGKYKQLLGRTYFDEMVPIDYSNSMFEMEEVPCK